MKNYKAAIVLVGACCVLALGVRIVYSQEKAAPSTAQVHMVITDQAFNDDSEVPVLQAASLKVKVGKATSKSHT